MRDWVARLNDAREALKATSTTNSSTTSPITIPVPPGTNRQAHHFVNSPNTQTTVGTSPPSANLITSESDSEDALGPIAGSAGYSPSAPTTMVASPSKAAQINPSKVIVQGYLMKCSRSKRHGWRKRWFVLTGEKLTYSASHMVRRSLLSTPPERRLPGGVGRSPSWAAISVHHKC